MLYYIVIYPQMKSTIKDITPEDLSKTPFKKLPEEAKIIISHKLKEKGLTSYSIAKLLGLGTSSVYRYIEEQPAKNSMWEQYGDSVSKLFKFKEDEIHAQLLSHIGLKIKDSNLDSSTRLLKVLSEDRREASRINIHSDKTMVFQVVKDNK